MRAHTRALMHAHFKLQPGLPMLFAASCNMCCLCKTQVRYQIDPSTPTGKCAVCVTGIERSLVAHLAAANNFKVAIVVTHPSCLGCRRLPQYKLYKVGQNCRDVLRRTALFAVTVHG